MISASMFSSPYRGSLISISRYIFKTGFKGRSRPLIGVLLSQCVLTAMTGQISVSFSSPYRGSLISIMKWNIVHECDNEFSSPYRGSLISIEQSFDTLRFHIPVLVPLSGFSYLNPVPYTSQNTRLLSPICGANPQMRETSISNWCITSTKPDFKPIGAKLSYFLKFNPPHPHMIQLSLILCTLTDMRCQFKLQVFGMFMHNIIFSKCIFKHIIHNFYCITAKQWI